MRLMRMLASCALAAMTCLGCVFHASAQQDVITTVVGGGPDGIPALNANLSTPQQIAIDSQGNYYIAAYTQNFVFKISTKGTITILAGTGITGYSGDGGQARAAELYYPQGVAVDAANPANVYISDTNNCLIRKVNQATGVITTIAGLVTVPSSGAPYTTCGYAGDGGAANAAEIYHPVGMAVNPKNNDLYFTDYSNGVVRRVAGGTATGTIITLAGGGGGTTAGNNCQGAAPFGDGGAANQAYLCYPTGVALDASVSPANVFISETSSVCDVREVVGSSGKIYQVAGSYTLGCGLTDNVKATNGQVYNPQQLAVQVSGKSTAISVADFNNNLIRQFTLTYAAGVPQPGNISTIAGNGSYYSGDGGPASSAGITQPVGLAFDGAGDYLIAGQGDDRLREVLKSTGNINTIAGWGNPNYSDPLGISGVAGAGVALYNPSDVFADPLSTKVYIGGYSESADYVWDSAANKVSDFAGNGTSGYAGDGTAANSATTQLSYPEGVVKDSSGNVYIADNNNCVIRKVNALTGNISTVAGGTNGVLNGCGYSGDGGEAIAAQVLYPAGLAIDSSNNLYIADYGNCLIRKVNATGIISTVAGLVTQGTSGATASNCGQGDGGPALASMLNSPTSVAVDGAGNLYIDDYNSSRIRKVDAITGIIRTVAGNDRDGYSGDGLALENSLYNSQRIAVDTNGNLFLSDSNNSILRWVDPAGQLLTFAGSPPGSPNGSNGFGGDGGVATNALLSGPQGIAQDATGNFYIADSGNSRIRKVTAFAGYGRSTGSLSFGSQPAGTTSEYQSVFLSAIGPVTINSIAAPTGFNEIDDCAGTSLTAGQTCEIDVFFSPTKGGVTEGTLSISSNAFFASQGSTVSLRGTATGLTVSGSLAFGSQVINSSTAGTVTLNNGGGAVALSSIYLNSPKYFSITGGTCPAHGGTLAGGAACTVTVAFDPTTTGFKGDTLVVKSNDAASPLLVGATGLGVSFRLSANSLAFATTIFGTGETLGLTVTNAGTTTLTVVPSIAGTGASAFSVLTAGNTCGAGVAAGKSCVLPVQFKGGAVGSFAASLTLTTNGGANPVVGLSGSDVTAVKVSTTTLAFGSVVEGASATQNLTVTNLGTQTLTVAGTISGSSAFTVLSTSANTCKSGVAAGKSCVLPVQFSPTAIQSYAGTLTLTTNGGSNPAISLTGAGSSTVTVSPTALAFGTITHGTTSVQTVTVSNLGASTIGVGTAVTGTGSAAFSVLFGASNTCEAGLAPGKSCSIPVQFAPAAAASYSATLTLFTGATNLTVGLTGAGK